ncbi:MAG: hypothetical protein AAF554_13755 [Bacteroidota bacterium]
MKKYNVTLLTDPRYLKENKESIYVSNVLQEDDLVIQALEDKGLTVTRKAWDDPNFDWTATQYAVFRATWDYFDRYEEFSQWFDQTKKHTQFINSAELIHWNIDKHYLVELENNGVRIPKTMVIEPGNKLSLQQHLEESLKNGRFKTRDFVLKPCIAGGARHTYKFNLTETAGLESIFQKLIQEEAMMLQEFQKNIMAEGEYSLMLFNGSYSHSVLKVAKPGDFRVQDDFGGTVERIEPTKEMITFAEKVVNASPEIPVYARVDIFRDNDDQWALAELEIFEPELWFRLRPKAANQLADAILKMIHDEKVS